MVIVDEFLILFLLRGPFAGGDVTHTIGSTHQGGDEGCGRRRCAVGRKSWGWGRPMGNVSHLPNIRYHINGPNYEIHRNSHPPWFSKGAVS